MAVNEADVGWLKPNTGIAPVSVNIAAVFLALAATGVAWALAPFINGKPEVAVAAAAFPILIVVLLGLPAFQCLRLGPRILLILLALRPLVDVSRSYEVASAGFTLRASSAITLQDAFAAIFGFLLLAVWLTDGQRTEYKKLPNIFLIGLLGLTTLSWLIGGLGEGARGWARTAWGLLVALLLGSLFRTERQIDIFVRTVFYSSFFVLATLGLNLNQGLSGDEFFESWRLGGQYASPNALAGVTFSFFLYGLYVFGRARTARGRFLSLLLLSLLAVVIVSTQSQTVGGLMLLSVCLCLWANRRRWLLFGVTVPLLLLLFASTLGTGWRLISSFSLKEGHLSPTVLSLSGRVYLWSDWLNNYLHASAFHKVFGLGWGVMLREFLSMKLFGSSVTESSFLWFLVGAGALGLVAFCAYLFWVLFEAWGAWRRASGSFEGQFALLAFLVTLSFVVEGFTTDVASAPNADVYLFAVMSIFVFQGLRKTARGSSNLVRNRFPEELEGAC